MNKTKIEWTDLSWNPITGCLHACDYCYARAIYERYGWSFDPTLRADRLGEPLKVKTPRRIFVCSVSDLMGAWVPREWVEQVIAIIRQCPQHTFQLLTKNPARYADFEWPTNCWLGATATNQEQWDAASRALSPVTSHVTYVSAEPLLSEVIPSNGFSPHWLIIGACTGMVKSQPERSWVERLELFADQKGCPVFHKPNLKLPGRPRREYPASVAV